VSLIQTAISGFSEYHKIETLFVRGKDFRVDPAQLKKPVFATIREWDVTEKIDGTNIRIMLGEDGRVLIGGRSNAAQVPADLMMMLVNAFPAEIMRAVMWRDGQPISAILYGEGYGAGIQKGGGYRPDKSFILFDVLVDGKWWLDREAVNNVAEQLACDVVPYYGRMNLEQIVELVSIPFQSALGSAMAEGIVARPIETLFDKKHERIILKLKTKDFSAGEK
jgi:hypothetical protein